MPIALHGHLPQPVESYPACDFTSASVALYRAGDVDVEVGYDHDFVAVHLVDIPRYVQRRDGRTSEGAIRAGDVIITPAGSPKRWQHEAEAAFIAVRLRSGFLSGLLAEQLGDAPAVRLLDHFGTRDAKLERLARRLHHELHAASLGSRLYADALVIQIGVHLLRHHCAAAQRSESRATLAPHKVRRATDYIRDHLDQDLTLDRIAAAIAMSPFHFAHAFKRAMGIAPHQFVLQCRVDRAMGLLRDTDLPIGEVASRVGIPNASHFSVLFRRATGLPPRRYRTGM